MLRDSNISRLLVPIDNLNKKANNHFLGYYPDSFLYDMVIYAAEIVNGFELSGVLSYH